VIGLVKERLVQDDCEKGYILDGFPRTTPQAEELDKVLSTMNSPLDTALSVDVDKNDLMKRLTGRRTCKSCQQMYNIHFTPPQKDDVCDKCGGELYQRDDDREETIKNRLDVYEKSTAPLIDYYGQKSILKSVEGVGSIDDIFSKICSILGQ
jgi:adenylate kinase